MVAATSARARVFLTTEEALALAFPPERCTVARDTVFLDAAQLARVEELAGEEPPTAVVHPYRATCDGRAGGTAYFDVHRVRTLPETLMVVVSPEGRIARVELLAFQEPPEYVPRREWYGELEGEELDRDLALKRDVPPVTGATLTARATVAAARRVLAVHQVLTAARGERAKDGEADDERAARRDPERRSPQEDAR